MINVYYCYTELTEKSDISLTPKEKLYASGATNNIEEGGVFIRLFNPQKQNFPLTSITYLKDVNKDWSGKIYLKMNKFNSKTIFHELNHAAQNILSKEKGYIYSEALMEVETRMILFYSAFLKADEATRKDSKKMEIFLKNYYGVNCDDLSPLWGEFFMTKDKKNKFLTEVKGEGYDKGDKIYKLVYDFFTHLNSHKPQKNADFDLLMKDYARWLVFAYGYSFEHNDFNPTYKLLEYINK